MVNCIVLIVLFFDNLGSYGGAVCCEPNSQAIFTNCKWNKNTAGSIFNSDVVQNWGEDIFVHNSAFVQIFYNSSSEKPQIGTMTSGAVQMINSSNNNISNNIVFNVNNTGDLSNAFAYLSSGSYSVTNVTINLKKNSEFIFDQTSRWFTNLRNYVFDNAIDFINSIENFMENAFHEKETSDIKDSENMDYLCLIKSGLNVTINGNGARIKSQDNDRTYAYFILFPHHKSI